MGLEPTHWCLTSTCSAAELPTRLKSVLRESNPPVQVGSLAPLPLGQGHVLFQRKPWDLNPQRLCTAPVFETGSSSSRMTSVFAELRWQESNLRRDG